MIRDDDLTIMQRLDAYSNSHDVDRCQTLCNYVDLFYQVEEEVKARLGVEMREIIREYGFPAYYLKMSQIGYEALRRLEE